MKTEDMILVSVDDHVVEPPDLFEGHLRSEVHGSGAHASSPRTTAPTSGSTTVKSCPNIGLNAVSGRPPEEYGIEPTAFSEMRAGCYDIAKRVEDMNANGVLGSMCFPSFPQFCGQLFAALRGQGPRRWRCCAPTTTGTSTSGVAATPGRFIPLALPVLWDPQLAADEVHRVARKGCHAVTFSENPEKLGYASFHSDYWDPFFAACEEEGTILCLHIGSSSELVITSIEAPINVMITLQPMNIVQAAADVLWSRVLQKFPGLRIALSEGGIGWIPYFLERVDYVYKNHRAWTGQKMDMLPSELFKERIVTCFIDDAAGIEARSHLDIDMITWECDYPHSDSTWPESPELLARTLVGVPDDEVDKMTHLNAMRIFQYDPFAHRPREQCTVGALRAEAAGVDVSMKSSGRKYEPPSEPIRIIDLAERTKVARGAPD